MSDHDFDGWTEEEGLDYLKAMARWQESTPHWNALLRTWLSELGGCRNVANLRELRKRFEPE